MMKDLYSITK